jgi:uncharacterized protein
MAPKSTLTPEGGKSDEGLTQSLCLSCGLCCDGTLFSQVLLNPSDDILAFTAKGLQISVEGGTRALKQPCSAHKGCACTVYADRPSTCRAYQCVLLKRIGRNEISHDAALGVIRETISLRNHVREQMLGASGDSEWHLSEFTSGFTEHMQEISPDQREKCYAPLFRTFVALQSRLDKYFRIKPFLPSMTVDRQPPCDATTTLN